MHATAIDTAPAAGTWPRSDRDAPGARETGHGDPLLWHTIGLETMASLLVVSLRRQGSHFFAARCQWPRLHPLNERTATVRHHPLIMAESTRQLATALEHTYLPGAGTAPFEPVSVSMGTPPRTQPAESGSATEVAVRVGVSDLVRREGGALVAYRVTAEYLHAGAPFGSCTMRFARRAQSAPAGEHPAVPPALLHPAAAAVGAAAEHDVLVARAPQGRLVVVPRDPAHPVLLPGRPSRLPTLALLEAGRQAALLNCGRTAGAVAGLGIDLRAPVPARGARLEVAADPGGFRFLVMVAGRVGATGTVALPRS